MAPNLGQTVTTFLANVSQPVFVGRWDIPVILHARERLSHCRSCEQMLMPKKNRIAIYELLFKEGVMVAKKDVHLPKHPELADKNVPNLHVMKAMLSLKSLGYVKEQFAWRHFYWYLTNEGIQYLRDFLHLPPEIVPATLRRQMRPETARPRPKGMEGERGERPARFNRDGGDRDNYRRSAAPPGGDKKAEAGAGSATEFQFRGGFGRGRGQQPPQE
uniref:Ribosomal protein S10 n=1 Tax=Hucho hucho TaxID=62062 RepID=A0A4W5RIC6_9TELE